MNRNLVVKCLNCHRAILKRCQSKNLVFQQCKESYIQRRTSELETPWSYFVSNDRISEQINNELEEKKCREDPCLCSKLNE